MYFHHKTIQVKELMCRYLVEQESSSGGPGEARGDEFSSVGQNGVTVCTSEEASPTNVIQEDPTHFVYKHNAKTKQKQIKEVALLHYVSYFVFFFI